ncbi:ABC transporter permease [Acaryochloris marina]|uniref:ABC transporter permease n=1 Tax=Acaryochloris marina TaxID=155978 RepID=UPI0021C33C69|nr:iron export ABC transporter permease subunit FetB [Acaryochloris marina]BDM83424.1 iron export ABC transporter permease subunit FetB [Acaryochloris marina MBIC10699]
MNQSYIPINSTQLALAASLILINVGLSVALRLGLAKSLVIATMRMVVQLLLVGYILGWVFTLDNPWLVLGVALFMSTIAGNASVNRTRRSFPSIYWHCLLSILASSALVTGLLVEGIIRVDPWYDPQYVIPLLGMVLGNALTATSLALDRFMEELVGKRSQIESLLALGATRGEAAHETINEALRTGMIPTINSMMVLGVVSLPGMMTGQMLAGVNPTDAVRYQIVIYFTIAAGTALACMSIVMLAFQVLFSPEHQLRLDRLQKRESNSEG